MRPTTRTMLSLPWVVLLAACATPDLKPFADQTASLGAAANAERAAVLERFETVIDLTKEYREQDKAKWQKAKNEYSSSSKVVTDLLGEVVQYSAALADLVCCLTNRFNLYRHCDILTPSIGSRRPHSWHGRFPFLN